MTIGALILTSLISDKRFFDNNLSITFINNDLIVVYYTEISCTCVHFVFNQECCDIEESLRQELAASQGEVSKLKQVLRV